MSLSFVEMAPKISSKELREVIHEKEKQVLTLLKWK